jgi:ribonucleoside-diphosphate reductase alpha chain
MKSVDYTEARRQTLEYFNNEELPTDSFLEKYALKNNDDALLESTPSDMHHRLAKEFARIEKNKFKQPLSEEEIFGYFDHFKYIVPQGSPMYGIGNNFQTISLSNCFLCDTPEDSYGDILRIDEQMVQLCKRRGGTGVDLSKLRPIGIPTHNAAHTTTGILSWMKRYANSIGEVGQNGRRGALIELLSIHHPQILDFIQAKDKKFDKNGKPLPPEVEGANLSVKLSNEFLQAVENNTDYEQRWPVDSQNPKISKRVNAREVWNEIIKHAHGSGEPGILMWDTVLSETPSSVYPAFKPQGTNPCSELILSPLDSCRLLLLNLYSYVKNPFTKEASFDFELFAKHAKIAQRLMDDLVDLESEKINKIIEKIERDPESEYIKSRELDMWKRILKYCNEGRRTGTGTTGLGDTLAALGVAYASEECFPIVEKIFKTLKLSCYRMSVDMAKELGAFACYDAVKEKESPFIQRIKQEDENLYNDMVKYGRRNIALLTISPAGTVSILTKTTSGVEPLFALSYKRRRKISNKNEKYDQIDENGNIWQVYEVYHSKILEWMRITGETDVQKSPWYGCCAQDISWINRVKMQSLIQKHICHSISSTVNLPNTATIEDVAKVYETAWHSGCKGITVYREGSRDGVLITNDTTKSENITPIIKTQAPKRPKELPCDIYHIKITKKLDKIRVFDYMVLIGLYNGTEPYEVFAIENGKYDKKITKGKIIRENRGIYHLVMDDGTEIKNILNDTTENEDALTRLTSTSLRHGVDIKYIVQQLSKVEGSDLFAFSKSIARALKHYIKEGVSGENCPNCGIKLIFENGCFICKNCGKSKC